MLASNQTNQFQHFSVLQTERKYMQRRHQGNQTKAEGLTAESLRWLMPQYRRCRHWCGQVRREEPADGWAPRRLLSQTLTDTPEHLWITSKKTTNPKPGLQLTAARSASPPAAGSPLSTASLEPAALLFIRSFCWFPTHVVSSLLRTSQDLDVSPQSSLSLIGKIFGLFRHFHFAGSMFASPKTIFSRLCPDSETVK